MDVMVNQRGDDPIMDAKLSSGNFEITESSEQRNQKKDKKSKNKSGDKFRRFAGEIRKKLDDKNNRQSRRIGSARNDIDGVKIKRHMNVAF